MVHCDINSEENENLIYEKCFLSCSSKALEPEMKIYDPMLRQKFCEMTYRYPACLSRIISIIKKICRYRFSHYLKKKKFYIALISMDWCTTQMKSKIKQGAIHFLTNETFVEYGQSISFAQGTFDASYVMTKVPRKRKIYIANNFELVF